MTITNESEQESISHWGPQDAPADEPSNDAERLHSLCVKIHAAIEAAESFRDNADGPNAKKFAAGVASHLIEIGTILVTSKIIIANSEFA